jgi:antitoxin HigA-1
VSTWRTIISNGMKVSRNRRPTHPGELLGKDILPSAGLTQAELARRIGVSRRSISEIVHEKRPITIDMAHRLARVFRTTPEFWLNMQQAVDLWEAMQENRKEYDQIKPMTSGKVA